MKRETFRNYFEKKKKDIIQVEWTTVVIASVGEKLHIENGKMNPLLKRTSIFWL
jgi:hypothetical protein